MKIYIWAFLLLLVPRMVFAGPIGEDEARELCARGAYSEEKKIEDRAWIHSSDDYLEKLAEGFLKNIDQNVPIVIICTTSANERDLVWQRLIGRGWSKDRAFVLGIHPKVYAKLEPHLRAIIAHEVGHLVNPDSFACKQYRVYKQNEDHVMCEHDADWVARNWVGKFAMLSALNTLLRFVESEGYPEERLKNLRIRIEMLKKAP